MREPWHGLVKPKGALMMMIRHAEFRDLDDIYQLAGKSGIGLTSLPPNRDTLAARITRTRNTLEGNAHKAEQGYLFVLEDTQTRQVVGVSAIEVAVGLTEPWYDFHVGTQVHASKALNIYKALPTLFLSNDHTGCSELCTLFLDPAHREHQNGKFLSKIRFLFIAAFRQHFEKRLIAEMRGFSDEQGESPFWNAIGQHFFNMDFATADYLSGIGQKIFIAELMPRFPVYVDLLPKVAQDVIGKIHPQTQPAFHVLESEGLKYEGYVDIFDAGPTLEADVNELRAVKESRRIRVDVVPTSSVGKTQFLVANDDYEQYRALMLKLDIHGNTLQLSQEQARTLAVHTGQWVRVLPLNPMEVY